ncbi:terpenoid synthase [Auricularia subglabra TFB-10046 SS5]|nr:terpenoid synthase [Auricularia subglabra TFB-10046 SS5]
MSTPTLALDPVFSTLCYEAASAKGYITEGWASPASYLNVGIAVSQTTFAHLKSTDARIWLALFTAFLAAIDDTSSLAPPTTVRSFIPRMMSGQRQLHPNLESFAAHLRQLSQHTDELRMGIILTSIFNWLNSLEIDRTMLDKEVPRASGRAFATWCGLMSGLGDAFFLHAFPSEVPFHAIAPTIPDMNIFQRNINDVFSFYKEERAGDCSTQISLLAQSSGKPKLVVLDEVAREGIRAHESICEALAEHPEARAAWISFAKGSVEFHFATDRYRLGELRVE